MGTWTLKDLELQGICLGFRVKDEQVQLLNVPILG